MASIATNREEGKLAAVIMAMEAELDVAEECRAGAETACRACCSALLTQPVCCDNAECPVLYQRTESVRDVESWASQLARLHA